MTYIPPTEDRLSALAEGVWLDGRYLARTEAHQCVRCGLWRRISANRATTDLCRDCKAQQNADIDAWIHFHTVQPMSAEDMRWCLAQEAAFNERRPVIYYSSNNRKDMAA